MFACLLACLHRYSVGLTRKEVPPAWLS